MRQDGVSLVELLLAISLVIGVVITLSLAFPKASANGIQIRQRAVAANLASSKIQILKSQPYDFLDATDTQFPAFNAGCDCRTVDFASFANLPSTMTVTDGATYTVAACVHVVGGGGAWPSQCLTSGDTGYKNIVVNVQWTNGSTTYSVTQQSVITRS
jgi:hypothetical protein